MFQYGSPVVTTRSVHIIRHIVYYLTRYICSISFLIFLLLWLPLQCDSITAKFGDEVTTISALSASSGEYEDFTLVFSYFSGVYEKEGYHAGRPVYKERRKFDRQPYKGNGRQRVKPAEIRYCQDINAWIFTHEHIKKGQDDSGCNWLLRSPGKGKKVLLLLFIALPCECLLHILHRVFVFQKLILSTC